MSHVLLLRAKANRGTWCRAGRSTGTDRNSTQSPDGLKDGETDREKRKNARPSLSNGGGMLFIQAMAISPTQDGIGSTGGFVQERRPRWKDTAEGLTLRDARTTRRASI